MSITLQDLRTNQRQLTIAFDDLAIGITYRPSAITPAFGTEERADKDWLVTVLLKLLVTWDVFVDDAETTRAPLDAATLSSDAFGVPLLRALYEQILDDALLPKARPAS